MDGEEDLRAGGEGDGEGGAALLDALESSGARPDERTVGIDDILLAGVGFEGDAEWGGRPGEVQMQAGPGIAGGGEGQIGGGEGLIGLEEGPGGIVEGRVGEVSGFRGRRGMEAPWGGDGGDCMRVFDADCRGELGGQGDDEEGADAERQ